MAYSLNETAFLASKAARGAGYPWGVAAEAGRATRWLAQRGVDGVAALAAVLVFFDDMALRKKWHCPILAGLRVSDTAAGTKEKTQILKDMAGPMMIVPFMAAAARQQHRPLFLSWPEGRCATDGQLLTIEGRIDTAMMPADIIEIGVQADDITFDVTESRLCTRAQPDEVSWAQLNDFAQRIYAPASEESRLLGAGAGLSDND